MGGRPAASEGVIDIDGIAVDVVALGIVIGAAGKENLIGDSGGGQETAFLGKRGRGAIEAGDGFGVRARLRGARRGRGLGIARGGAVHARSNDDRRLRWGRSGVVGKNGRGRGGGDGEKQAGF